MRPFQAFRFTTGLVLLPFLLVVVWLFSGVLENVSPEYDQSVSGKASSAVIPVAPMLAAACAWTGWRVHRTRRQFMNSVRSGFVVAVDGLWPLLFVGGGAILFSYGLEFFYSGLSFRPDPRILAVSLLLVFAVCCASYSLGTKLTPLISAPLALSLTYAWLVVPSTLDTLWVRHMNGVLDDCCSVESVVAPDVLAAATALYTALLIAGSLLFFLPSRSSHRRFLAGAAALLLIGGAAVSADFVRGRGYSLAQERTEGLLCRRGQIEVCVWKEHSRELPRISAVADDFAAHLRELGIQPKGQLTQASDSSDPDIGHFGFRSDPTDLRIRSALAGALAPSLSEKCREKMVQKQGQKTMRLVANHAVMHAWILHVLGVPRSEPMDTQTRTALRTVLTESKESQAQWFRTTASTARSCRL